MKKRSAKCLVNILVKNSFFNIWSTFKQHNYVDQSISVSQVRYIESLELCYCIQHLGNYCYPNVDQMLKNELFTKIFTKHFAERFFIRVVVWLQLELEFFLNISHCFVNKFSHNSIFFVMKENHFKSSWKVEHAHKIFFSTFGQQ